MSIPVAARTRPSARGRRRDEAISEAIVDATLAILREEGYDGLTIEAIARRAGVSRPAIYTRWRTLHDLVLEAARQARDSGPVFEGIMDVPDTGELRGDLLSMMRDSVALHRRMDERGILNGFVAGIVADPSLGPVFRANFMDPDFHRLMVIFERARERGELSDDVDPTIGLELLVGAGFYRSVITRDPLDDAWLEAAIDLVVGGLTQQG
jgi:AcrR family transcriptional regulator